MTDPADGMGAFPLAVLSGPVRDVAINTLHRGGAPDDADGAPRAEEKGGLKPARSIWGQGSAGSLRRTRMEPYQSAGKLKEEA